MIFHFQFKISCCVLYLIILFFLFAVVTFSFFRLLLWPYLGDKRQIKSDKKIWVGRFLIFNWILAISFFILNVHQWNTSIDYMCFCQYKNYPKYCDLHFQYTIWVLSLQKNTFRTTYICNIQNIGSNNFIFIESLICYCA